MFTVKIDTSNAVFDPGPGEVQRLLAEIIRDLTDEPDYTKYRTLFDINGNSVGQWKYEPGEHAEPQIARRRRRDGRSMMPRAHGA